MSTQGDAAARFGVGSPEWYDQPIDWLAEHLPLEQRAEILRLVDARNAVARRYGKPERAVPLHVAWYLMVDMAAAWRELWILAARHSAPTVPSPTPRKRRR